MGDCWMKPCGGQVCAQFGPKLTCTCDIRATDCSPEEALRLIRMRANAARKVPSYGEWYDQLGKIAADADRALARLQEEGT